MIKIPMVIENQMSVPNIYFPKIATTKYSRMRMKFLMENKLSLLIQMGKNNQLQAHIMEVEQRAEKLKEQLVAQMKAQQNVDEKLKQQNWLLYNQKMQSIIEEVEEIVLNEIIYN